MRIAGFASLACAVFTVRSTAARAISVLTTGHSFEPEAATILPGNFFSSKTTAFLN
jgi:hypothetical protein